MVFPQALQEEVANLGRGGQAAEAAQKRIAKLKGEVAASQKENAELEAKVADLESQVRPVVHTLVFGQSELFGT